MILDAVNLSSDAEGGTNAGKNCPSGIVHPQAHNAFWEHLVRLPVMAGASVRTDNHILTNRHYSWKPFPKIGGV